jgi:hypothetical protein
MPPTTEITHNQGSMEQWPSRNAKTGVSDSQQAPPPFPDNHNAQVECDDKKLSNDEQFTKSLHPQLSFDALSEQVEDFSIDNDTPTVQATLVHSTQRRVPINDGLRRIIPVVIGGLLALPLAQFVLWYWPWGPQDPFKLGPELSSFAAVKWLVPEEFHESSP